MPIEEVYVHPELTPEEELCTKCRGQGRVVYCHRMMGPNDYMECPECGGSGKTIKRPKCRIEGCTRKQEIVNDYDFTGPSARKVQTLDPNGLCEDHGHELGNLESAAADHKKRAESAQVLVDMANAKLKESTDSVAAFKTRIMPLSS